MASKQAGEVVQTGSCRGSFRERGSRPGARQNALQAAAAAPTAHVHRTVIVACRRLHCQHLICLHLAREAFYLNFQYVSGKYAI